MTAAGFPHSATSGSPAVCASPELFAAYRGLPRLRVPRHPPHAFARLTTSSFRRRPSRARADVPADPTGVRHTTICNLSSSSLAHARRERRSRTRLDEDIHIPRSTSSFAFQTAVATPTACREQIYILSAFGSEVKWLTARRRSATPRPRSGGAVMLSRPERAVNPSLNAFFAASETRVSQAARGRGRRRAPRFPASRSPTFRHARDCRGIGQRGAALGRRPPLDL
jgi:hypothetical protein